MRKMKHRLHGDVSYMANITPILGRSGIVERIRLAQDREQWQGAENTVITLRVAPRVGVTECLSVSRKDCISRR